MNRDEEIAKRAVEHQQRARDIPMTQIPAYQEWSKRKLGDGEAPALIANLDATAMWLMPEEIHCVTNDLFDEMLADLKAELSDNTNEM